MTKETIHRSLLQKIFADISSAALSLKPTQWTDCPHCCIAAEKIQEKVTCTFFTYASKHIFMSFSLKILQPLLAPININIYPIQSNTSPLLLIHQLTLSLSLSTTIMSSSFLQLPHIPCNSIDIQKPKYHLFNS